MPKRRYQGIIATAHRSYNDIAPDAVKHGEDRAKASSCRPWTWVAHAAGGFDPAGPRAVRGAPAPGSPCTTGSLKRNGHALHSLAPKVRP